MGDDAAALDVANQRHRQIGGLGKAHIGDVAGAQIDFGRAAGALNEDEIGRPGEPVEGGEHGRQQRRRERAVLTRRGRPIDAAAQHDLRRTLRLRLQQHRVHVDRRRDTAGARLQRLGPADLAAIGGDHRIVRHVLRLERPHR